MQAIILAAGMGKRLKNLTENNTKCMVKVNGVTLIERMLKQLDILGLERIVIVVGYKKDTLMEYISGLSITTNIEFVENPIYDKTNNIYSLYLAKKQLLEKDTILLESDIIFEDSVLRELVEDKRETLAVVDKYESWMDGTVVKLSEKDEILEFTPGKKFVFEDIPQYYKTVNIYKFSKHFSQTQYVPFLEAYQEALGYNEYYEQVLRVLTLLDDSGIRAKRLHNQRWYEIDDVQDLDIASSIFTDEKDRLCRIQNRYGGYWRYPKMLDFCYLVNPYFPPQRLLDEIKANFDDLVTQYPSGADVNSLLAARNFSVEKEHIAVGNGAAELIKILMENRQGKVGFIRPTFEEYPNCSSQSESVVYNVESENFSYSAKDVLDYFKDKDIQLLVLINPDNPSGNYIPKKDVLWLANQLELRGITLLLDESFVDFADDSDSSLICEEILAEYSNLIIVKSISESFGVPGLRLGIAVSGNRDTIDLLKSDISIWNINSLAEFYMQIEEKYKADYKKTLQKFREARRMLLEGLRKIEFLTAFDSQANYIMCRLNGDMTAKELTEYMLSEHNILIKDLSTKLHGREYVRIAVRTVEDNRTLLRALQQNGELSVWRK